MKKNTIIVILLLLTMLLCACGNPLDAAQKTTSDAATQPQAQLPNPVKQMTADEVGQETGVYLEPPEGSSESRFSVISRADSSPIAQMDFMMGEISCCLRVCSADIPDGKLEDISGLYYTWDNESTITVAYNEAFAYWNKDGIGYAEWYDFAPGLLYCLSMSSNASAESLEDLAAKTYKPVQGNA